MSVLCTRQLQDTMTKTMLQSNNKKQQFLFDNRQVIPEQS